MIKSIRTPDEIRQELQQAKYKVQDLEKELEISLMVNNENSYSKYIGKWVLCDAYESGFSYIHVLGVGGDPDGDLFFYGYGIEYDAQSKEMRITSQDYPENFLIYYPNNIKEIDPRHIKEDLLDFLKLEFEEELGIEYED